MLEEIKREGSRWSFMEMKNRIFTGFGKLRSFGKIAVIWGLSTLFATVLSHIGVRAENLLLIYVVGVILCSVETRSMLWSISSSIVFVFTFNFLLTSPRFTFQVDDPNYIISLLIFIIVAFIAASLTDKLQKQMNLDRERAEILLKLNTIGSGFLNLSGRQAVISYSMKSLHNLTGKKTELLLKMKDERFSDQAAEWCFRNSTVCGYGEAQYGDRPCLYVPVCSLSKTYGVIIFWCSNGGLTKEERMYVEMVISQITLVLEREQLNEEKEESGLQIERERLKSTLLRSISHDLRTPLTGIAGNSNFLYENYDLVDEESAKSMLLDISTESEWLNSMVENLLNMTRIQEGKLEIRKKREVVDDLISGAAALVSKRLGDHTLKTVTPPEIELISVDARLFTQVLVNLIDNGIRHSGDNTVITVSAGAEGRNMVFTVSDNGTGIPEDKLDHIFDSFFTAAYREGDRQRGAGLGLAICKAIVEAHGGKITIDQSWKKGTAFRIEMPMEETYDQ
jgi:two-component system sensor histidine kinase KdpD